MKKNLLTLTLIISLFQSTHGQELKQAPLSSEFENFMKENNKVTGDIPSPSTYVFDKNFKLDLSKISFPDVYDLRNEMEVSSVKNQGNAGHCWSFAAIGAIEARSLKLGFEEIDLSEHNMATCHGFEWEEGGNQSIATAYLSRLSGPILETQDPYNDYEFSCSATNTEPQFYVPESRFLPKNADIIKYYLMNYGAIAVSYYHNDSYFRSYNNTYYYSGEKGSNHGVLLVGWNDNKTTSGGTGAWIIKNSWGSFWGDDGFFYMSYNDTHAIDKATLYPLRLETNNIDTILMYDDFGEITSYGYGNYEGYALIKHSISEEYNFNKVGTYIGAMNSIIDIEVFETKTDDILTDTLAKKYDLFCEFPGYYTFDVPFTTNKDFYIKIKYFTPNDQHPIPAEVVVDDYAYPEIESQVGWISANGENWKQIGAGTNDEMDLCIRAYGSKSDIKSSFTSDYETICLNSLVEFTSNSSGNITKYSWDFGKDATPATASSEGPIAVSYSTEGFKTVKLVVENEFGTKDSVILYNHINVSNEIKVDIAPGDSIFLLRGNTLELNAYGAYSYNWYPENMIIGNVSSNTVEVSPVSDTTLIYLDGEMNTCSNTDSLIIYLYDLPENDDVCDAIELTLNKEEGPFSNSYATVQENEPHPVEGGCTTPLEWCEEGGLQNSIWFKFTAPKSGTVKINTEGFDNQIAVYDAENCTDIISGNESLYELIAANDDYSSTNYAASIDEITGLTANKTYWIQLDGSAGGDEGECTITVTELKASNDSPCEAKELDLRTTYSENNNYASVDENEPYPDNTDCTTQNSWCPNDNLNATVWYKFTSPASEQVSIQSTGFDNQIAVYEVSECNDLLSGNSSNYTILAANDNYEGNEAASIELFNGLTEGTVYYIQVDGKNDEFYGNFTLYINEWPLATEDINISQNIIIYPNPVKDNFIISGIECAEISIYNTSGTLVKKLENHKNNTPISISNFNSGLYYINIIQDNNTITKTISIIK